MKSLLDLAGEILGVPVAIDRQPPQPGDVDRTGGAIERAHRLLGWAPQVRIAEGLARQAAWQRERRAA
jgi:nucleoside-diphosphate-sugar epimerase